jgi:cysteine synthase A
VNQYSNVYTAAAHHRTMEEICAFFNGQVDYLFCPASTCGTLRGCAEYLRKNGMDHTRIIAVDAVGSVIFGGAKGKRLIPGHGAGTRPGLYQEGLADRCIPVTDLECVIGCRLLLSKEALLVGGTAGATLMAVEHIKDQIPSGANCVLIFPDRGERYLDTIYCDEWVEKQFGCSLKEIDHDDQLRLAQAGAD